MVQSGLVSVPERGLRYCLLVIPQSLNNYVDLLRRIDEDTLFKSLLLIDQFIFDG